MNCIVVVVIFIIVVAVANLYKKQLLELLAEINTCFGGRRGVDLGIFHSFKNKNFEKSNCKWI